MSYLPSIRWLLLLVAVLAVTACSFGVPISSRDNTSVTVRSGNIPSEPRSTRGNPESYVVFGKRYYVMDSANGFVERGIASWYGTKFHGRKTSNGETYNMYALSAAHKTLPIPVHVHVKNLDNGRSLVVRVNDRGPFVDGRIIDLSYATAKKLGVDGPGTANVEIRVVEPGQKKPTQVARAVPLTDTDNEAPLFIQMGAFSERINADNMVLRLQQQNEASASIVPLRTDNGTFYRVRVGPLYDMDEANQVVRRLQQKGYSSLRVVVEQ